MLTVVNSGFGFNSGSKGDEYILPFKLLYCLTLLSWANIKVYLRGKKTFKNNNIRILENINKAKENV